MAEAKWSEKNRSVRIQKPKSREFDRPSAVFLGLLTTGIFAFYLFTIGMHVRDAAIADWHYHQSKEYYTATSSPTLANLSASRRARELYLGDERRALHSLFTTAGWTNEVAGYRLVVSWRMIECGIAIMYLAFFLCVALRIPKRLGGAKNSFVHSDIKEQSDFPKPIGAIFTAAKRVAMIAGDSIRFYRFVYFLCLISFLTFFVVHVGAAYYGVRADASQFYKALIWALGTATTLLIGYHGFTARTVNGTPSEVRRAVLKTVVFGMASAVALKYIQKAPQIAKLGFVPRPRFKQKKNTTRHVVSLPPGLYKHVKSNRIYYVDEAKFLHANHPISPRNLARASNITESQFNDLPGITAKVYFENYGLYLLKNGRFLDALGIMELGCAYEIRRLKGKRGIKANIRIFKLYSGLCHRTNKKDRLRILRERIKAAGLEPLLQPRPEKWLKSKAWCFKGRWLGRAKYNGQNLTVPTR